MNKVAFLDFDGVLTSEPFTRQCIFEYPCDSYVVLDDDDLHLPNQVKTAPHTGLVDKNVIEAISILNNTEDYVKTE